MLKQSSKRIKEMRNNFEIFENVVEVHQEDGQVEISSKEEKMVEYIRSLRTIEDAIQPFQEQKRELKSEFKQQGWLTGDEISMTVKAYRMMKNDGFDLEEFTNICVSLRKLTGIGA